jgi:ADP-heptose:LPS heptosyltransferase
VSPRLPGKPERILAVRLARLGDVTLVLPALGMLRAAFPDARLTLLTGAPYAPLAQLCPWVDDVIALDRHGLRDGSRRAAVKGIFDLVRQLRAPRFDLAVDFHSFRETNLLVRASGARWRVGMQRSDRAYLGFCFNLPPVMEDKGVHVGEMFRRVAAGVPGVGEARVPPGPVLRVPEGQAQRAVDGDWVLALYVGASTSSRRWPPERFARVATHALRHWGASVRILAGLFAEEQEAARVALGMIGASPRVGATIGASLPELVTELSRADVLLSNDSGPMHIGSALGIPTLGVFSEGHPLHYRPLGVSDRYVYGVPVERVSFDEVLEVLGQMRPVST